jgi:hypothetical protein
MSQVPEDRERKSDFRHDGTPQYIDNKVKIFFVMQLLEPRFGREGSISWILATVEIFSWVFLKEEDCLL